MGLVFDAEKGGSLLRQDHRAQRFVGCMRALSAKDRRRFQFEFCTVLWLFFAGKSNRRWRSFHQKT